MNEPYFIEVDTNGCSKCGHDRTWTVIGPDGTAHHTSYSDIEDAESLAEALNAAFYAGLNEKQREMRRARKAISKVVIPPASSSNPGTAK
jgi:hypothetical protein